MTLPNTDQDMQKCNSSSEFQEKYVMDAFSLVISITKVRLPATNELESFNHLNKF